VATGACSPLLLLLLVLLLPLSLVLCFAAAPASIVLTFNLDYLTQQMTQDAASCICIPSIHSVLHLSCLQVTNRDLSIAVLRKFLPQLAQELSDGTVKRNKNTFPRVKQEPAGQVRQAAG
jgi:hypothetical protein